MNLGTTHLKKAHSKNAMLHPNFIKDVLACAELLQLCKTHD
ncbi:MAG: hypothetical protein QRY71_02795 [Candidatus Rhabdochlamydia sp.]